MMIRTLSCLFVFGVGSEALGGSSIAVFACGALALWINHVWHQQERDALEQRHIAQVEAEEHARLRAYVEFGGKL